MFSVYRAFVVACVLVVSVAWSSYTSASIHIETKSNKVANTITLSIVDKNGKPVSNAVVSVSSSKPPVQSSSSNSHSNASANASSNASNEQKNSTRNLSIMDQVNYQFVPKVLVIEKGQWVDFPNSDDVRHHVYSFSEPKFFEIKMYKGSEAKPVQFDTPGIVVMGCNIHDSMIGYIYVADGEQTAISKADGTLHLPTYRASLTATPQNTLSIDVWHPQLSTTSAKKVSFEVDVKGAKQQIVLDFELDADAEETTPTNTFNNKFKRT